MKNYSFAYYNDDTNEAIDTKQFKSLLDAIEYFAAQKQLSAPDFLRIYKVLIKNEQQTRIESNI
jgi:hypothetical protein